MLLVNVDYIPGKNLELLGMAKGTVVQSKNFGKDFMAGMKTLVGGEITGYTEMLNEARQIAIKRMVDEATALGADAIINIRYGSSSVMQGAAEACAGEDGVIIMCCSCADGMGGTHFEKLITMGTVEEIDQYLSKIPPKETIPEQWCPQIYARILKKHPVILVTTYLPPEQVKQANMIPAATPDEALEIAYRMKGKDASVVVIPDGVAVLAVKE